MQRFLAGHALTVMIYKMQNGLFYDIEGTKKTFKNTVALAVAVFKKPFVLFH